MSEYVSFSERLRKVAEWLDEQGVYLRGWEEEEGRCLGSQEYGEKADELRALADYAEGKVMVATHALFL